jgi:beta-glucosidase-like glycosyl hydrolase
MRQKTIVAALLFLGSAAACVADAPFVDSLAATGALAIPLEQARGLESRLGQLLIVNVDGFGYSGALALAPGYADLVRRLQIGGVIPHYGSTSYERIRGTNRALAELTRQPLLLCCDIVRLRTASGTGAFGDGYVGGFLGKYKRLSDDELATLARLNGLALAGIGITVALGPTVDGSTGDPRTAERARLVMAEWKGFGLEPVIKHFPFLPAAANLHHASPDTRVEPAEAARRYAVFTDLAAEAGIMMSTHLRDSAVDRDIATFSPRWIGILREATAFRGLLMSDGLLMLKNYTDRSMLAGGPAARDVAGIDEAAVWALRAILAGHDMVIVEGSAAQTVRVFQGLLTVACGGSASGRELRGRIEESASRITAWKAERARSLRRTVEVAPETIAAAVRLLPAEDARLGGFRFDPAALARLAPALEAARAAR